MRIRSFIPFGGALLLMAVTLLCSCSEENPRSRTSFNTGWKFLLADDAGAAMADFDDSGWRMLDLPHDWSIEGEFSVTNPATPGGGALPGGIGWYRKTFTVDTAEKDRLLYIEFDGVYRNSEVWINGHHLGKRPYGYSSFRYDLTPWLKQGSEENTVAVRVDNSLQPNSRWYSGSGIYRNVWLVATGKTAVDHWGTFITTPEVSADKALVRIEASIRNLTGAAEKVSLVSSVYDADNRKVASVVTKNLQLTDTVTVVKQEVNVENPLLWSDRDPNLYRVVTDIIRSGKLADRYETITGIRSFEFNADRGFILNGKETKILGVCNHHDLGFLGAAVNTRAIERQLEILKEMGCNAIRTSHNPPAPELLDLCDRMGFIVMDEAFDMWKLSKTKYDYSLDWDLWWKRDLEDMILRDRNHPGVIIWSIGNEILEQWDSTGTEMAMDLAATVRSLDDTRPVTSGCNDPNPWNYIIKSGALDLIGFNYHDSLWVRFPETFPGQKFIGTETGSALATRGSYAMPSDSVRRWPLRWDIPFREGNAEMSCSSYDNCSAPWGSTHEESWKLIKANNFLSGMFYWTGFDYLGEPTPYPWPARSSYFGIVDLAGFPKDPYYMYQSEWTDKPVLHIFPHWNWNPGQTVDVWAYTNCDEVELFLNDKSLGVKSKTEGEFHIAWRVPYEPGRITAVGKVKGKETLRTEVKTAGEPAAITLTPDRSVISAGGTDLSFITVTVVDKENNQVPWAENLIQFAVEGNATVAGVDNGSQISMEPFKADYRKAFHGKCLVVIKAGEKAGDVKVTASSEGLGSAVADLQIR